MPSTNSIAVSAVTVPPAAEAPGAGGLARRAASALVLAGFGALSIEAGGVLFYSVVLLVASLLVWEWARLADRSTARAGAAGASLLVALAVGLTLSPFSLAFGLVVAVAVVWLAVGLIAVPSGRWTALGIFYVGAWAVAALWLRADPTGGREAVFWLVGVCIATDTGAYFIGRALRGPKLAPRLSPNKTWAGCIGGLLCAGAVGYVAAPYMRMSGAVLLAVASVGVSIAAQAGDLLESAAKRRHGVKNSGNLIPGHGGLFDRFDSIIGATLAVAAACLFIGRSVILW
ncbi:MAG: phosphatidate cytidylyltransferase [Alphaproteobacteria bacterium]